MAEAVTRADLVEAIVQEVGLDKPDAERALTAVTRTMQQAMEDGRRVILVGFGAFHVTYRQERIALHPKTREPIAVPEQRQVKFRPSKALKEALNR